MDMEELVQSLRDERAAGVFSIKLDRARDSPVLLAVAQLGRADDPSRASSLAREKPSCHKCRRGWAPRWLPSWLWRSRGLHCC